MPFFPVDFLTQQTQRAVAEATGKVGIEQNKAMTDERVRHLVEEMSRCKNKTEMLKLMADIGVTGMFWCKYPEGLADGSHYSTVFIVDAAKAGWGMVNTEDVETITKDHLNTTLHGLYTYHTPDTLSLITQGYTQAVTDAGKMTGEVAFEIKISHLRVSIPHPFQIMEETMGRFDIRDVFGDCIKVAQKLAVESEV